MSMVKPQIHVLSRENREQVHRYSLDILSRVGIRVDFKPTRDLFAAKGFKVDDSQRVFIPAERVDWALTHAPSVVDIYNRNGKPAFKLGNGENCPTRFGVGVTNLYYQHPDDDRVEPFDREHMALASTLGDALNQFDLVATPGVLKNQPPDTADLIGTLEMLANTVKPLVLLVSNPQCFNITLDMLAHLTGELNQHPYLIPYFNPITPLVLNETTAKNMMITVERGLPLIYNNYGMSGATTPITPGGTLAVLNAELLAGLVYSQVLKEGAPIILGSLPAGFDMQSMQACYTPQTMLVNLACAEMMAHYGLPHSGTSGSGPGWGPDLLASGMHWMNHLTSCMGKVGLAPLCGGNFSSVAFSPPAVVYANEIITQARQFSKGFSLGEIDVAPDEITAIGAGGNFLMADMTVKRCREINYGNPIWPEISMEEWQERGMPKAETFLREYTLELLTNHSRPDDRDTLIEKGEAYIKSCSTIL
jgi:trimethylamine--corrinoid protein Co-methyltransferase